jgi:hypothetical protein
MPVQLTGTGGLFTRLGLLLGGINEVNVQRNTTLNTRVTNILAQYLTNQQAVIAPITSDEAQYRQTQNTWLQSLQNDAINTVISMANDDTPLTQLTLSNALKLIIQQMVDSGNTLQQPVVSATVVPNVNNYGDTQICASLTNELGLTNYMVNCETISATCTADAGNGATIYQEPFQFQGWPVVDPLYYTWPGGSGCNASVQTTNAAQTGGIVTDGNFSSWSGNTPLEYTINVGTAGTTIFKGVSPVRGSFNLQYTGNGSELTSISQELSNLTPNSVLGVSFWAKRSSGAAAGVLQIAITDGSGTTLTDDQGNACAKSVTVSSGLTTSYSAQYNIFALPKVLPTVIQIRIRLTTAVTNAETVSVSLLQITPTTLLYQGGVRVFTFSGATQAAIGDRANINVLSNISTSGFIPSLSRILNLRQLNLAMPSSLTPSISNSLIQ